MKVALIGNGKTGHKVLEVLGHQNVTVFNKENPVTVESLKGHDVAICFIPGPAFLEISDTLIASRICVVTGATGIAFPEELQKAVKESKLKWIHGHNFALGMNLVYNMIKVLAKADKLFDDLSFDIHEVHHTKKLDAPSGTAISWKEWLGHECNITSDRTGDVIGDHTLTLNSETERIRLEHNSLDRKIFAKGAIWAADKVLNDNTIEYGINKFEDIARKELI